MRAPLRTRRGFVQQVSLAMGTLAWPVYQARAVAGSERAHVMVLVRPAGDGTRARAAADGFAMGIDEMTRSASLLGGLVSGVEIRPSASGLDELRTLLKPGTPLTLVSGAAGPQATRAAEIVAAAGGLVFCGHERLVDEAWTWMPPDEAVVDLIAEWAFGEGRRTWYVISTDDRRDRVLFQHVRRAATDGGARIVEHSIAATRTGATSDPDADLIVVASHAPKVDVDALGRPGVPVAYGAVAANPQGGRRRLVPEVWHGSLRRYGATQLNNRFQTRVGRPMTSTAWGHWLAVKAAWEATARFPDAGQPGAAMTRGEAIARLVLDGQKGVGLRFEAGAPLEQPLYLVERGTDADGQESDVVVATRERPGGRAARMHDGRGMRGE